MWIAVVTTMDTKGAEAVFVADFLRQHGANPLLVDVGVMGEVTLTPDISRQEVAAAAGYSLENLRAQRRDEIMSAMGRGAGALLAQRLAEGRLHGALALGGNQGSAIAAFALKQLPIGFPKLIVSTVASGNVRPYVGHKDIAMMFSVADILGGPNSVTRTILANAAGAVLGMAQYALPMSVPTDRRVIALTAFGNTNGAVTRAHEQLVELGYEVIVFHASGACGSAMEDLIAQGRIHGVLDITTHELLGEICPDDIYAPVTGRRLEAAAKAGIPQVIGPGGLEYFCFGPMESVPPSHRDRPTHFHNPYNMNVRSTAAELARVGKLMGERLNTARGPVIVLIPERGWSYVGSPGGLLHDLEANQAFITALQAALRPPAEIRLLDCALNDPIYADTAVDLLHNMMEKT